jgi:hypothetical protein
MLRRFCKTLVAKLPRHQERLFGVTFNFSGKATQIERHSIKILSKYEFRAKRGRVSENLRHA